MPIIFVLNPTMGIRYTLLLVLGTALDCVGIHLPILVLCPRLHPLFGAGDRTGFYEDTPAFIRVVSYTGNKLYPLVGAGDCAGLYGDTPAFIRVVS